MFEIDFTDNEPGISELIGTNGIGKSSLIKIFKIALFGKTEGIAMSDIANEVNGNGYTDIYFKARGRQFRIERGFAPNFVKLYEDNSPQPTQKGGLPELKKYIESEVIDIPYHIFDNVLNLNISDFKSFLTMNADNTRKIRDRIFSFYILNEMAELLKVTTAESISQLDILNNNLLSINENLQNSENQYNDLKEKMEKERDEKKSLYEQQLADYKNQAKSLGEAKQRTLDDIKISEAKLRHIGYLLNKENLSLIERQIESFEIGIKNDEQSLNERKQQADVYDAMLKTADNLENWNRLNQMNHDLACLCEHEYSINEQLSETNDYLEKAEANLLILKDFNKNHKETSDLLEIANSSVISCLTYFTEKSNLAVLQDKKNELQRNREKLIIAEQKNLNDIQIYEKKINLYNQGKCPECGTDLSDDTHINEKTETEALLVEAEKKKTVHASIKEKLATALNDVNKGIEKADSTFTLSRNKIVINVEKLTKESENYTLENNKIFARDIAKICHHIITGVLSDLTETDISNKFNDIITKIVLPSKPDNINDSEDKISFDIKNLSDTKNIILKEIANNSYKAESLKESIAILEKTVPKPSDELSMEIIDKEQILGKQNEIRESLKKLNEDLLSKKSSLPFNIERKKSIENELSQYKIPSGLEEILSSVGIDMVDTLENNIKALKIIHEEQQNSEQTLNFNITTTNANIKALSEFSNIEEQLSHITNSILQYKQQVEEKTNEYERQRKLAKYYQILNYTLSDNGIKAYILKEIVPSINFEISNILSALNISLNVMFNEEFKPTVTRLGKTVGLKSISTGQTKMVDFAILVAITKILKMKYGELNLAFYDEIFSSIEANNRVVILELINKMLCNQLKMNIWVVNHGHMPSSFFKNIIQISQSSGFSEITISNPNDMSSN